MERAVRRCRPYFGRWYRERAFFPKDAVPAGILNPDFIFKGIIKEEADTGDHCRVAAEDLTLI